MDVVILAILQSLFLSVYTDTFKNLYTHHTHTHSYTHTHTLTHTTHTQAENPLHWSWQIFHNLVSINVHTLQLIVNKVKTFVCDDIFKDFSLLYDLFSSMASMQININWIRTGFEPYCIISYYRKFLRIMIITPRLFAWDPGPSGSTKIK